MPTIKHKKTSAKADTANAALVRPSDWNNTHDMLTVAGSVYLGQNATGAGPVLELPITATSGDDFTLWTKAAIQAAITAAIAGYKPFATGDFSTSIATSKQGWVLCNGQGLFLGNGQSNHDLFVMLWSLNGNSWPVNPTRGTSAEQDWLDGKTVPVPDARGCVLGMVDTSGIVSNLIGTFGVKVGLAKVPIDITNVPAHDHGLLDPANMLFRGNLGGTGSGTPVQFDGVSNNRTTKTGGDPAASPPYDTPIPINVTQPTMGVNIFIKL